MQSFLADIWNNYPAIGLDVISKLKEDLNESVKRQNQKLAEYVSLNKKFATYFNE